MRGLAISTSSWLSGQRKHCNNWVGKANTPTTEWAKQTLQQPATCLALFCISGVFGVKWCTRDAAVVQGGDSFATSCAPECCPSSPRHSLARMPTIYRLCALRVVLEEADKCDWWSGHGDFMVKASKWVVCVYDSELCRWWQCSHLMYLPAYGGVVVGLTGGWRKWRGAGCDGTVSNAPYLSSPPPW